MLESNAERLSLMKIILRELSELNGGPWKEACGEMHAQYNNMVFSVLLFEDSDPKETHQAFCKILAPHIENMVPLEAQLFYEKFTEDGRVLIERMRGNEAVLAALKKDTLGGCVIPLGGMKGVFRSTDSKR